MTLPPLWDSQVEALDWIAGHERAWLSVPMGRGKTRIVCEAVRRHGLRRVLVLCPSSVVDVWLEQTPRWMPNAIAVCKLAPGTPTAQRARALGEDITRVPWEPEMYVTNYEAILQPGFRKAVEEVFAPDLIVYDECHLLKDANGKLSKTARKLADVTGARIIAMTGTIMPHGPEDLWAQAKLADPAWIHGPFSRYRAAVMVLGGPNGTWTQGTRVDPADAKHYDPEVAEWLAAKLARLVFVDDSTQPIGLVNTFRTHPLPDGVRRLYAELRDQWVLDLEQGHVAPANALVRILRLAQLASGWLPLDDYDTQGIAHVEREQALEEVLSQVDEKVVVGCRFLHELADVKSAATNTGRSYGEVSGRRKDGLVGGKHAGQDVIAVQYQAGGVGIDLSAASLVVLYGHTYSLGDYDQFIARLRRPGQAADTVRAVHLLAEDTVDQAVYSALDSRRDVVSTVMNAIQSERGEQ